MLYKYIGMYLYIAVIRYNKGLFFTKNYESKYYTYIVHRATILQGVPTQTVKSNLEFTDRKHAINFNLKVDSDQGRLGI